MEAAPRLGRPAGGAWRGDSAESMLRRPQMEELLAWEARAEQGVGAPLWCESSEPRCIAAKPAKGLGSAGAAACASAKSAAAGRETTSVVSRRQ